MTDTNNDTNGGDDAEWRELVDDDLLDESDSEHLDADGSNPGGSTSETTVQDADVDGNDEGRAGRLKASLTQAGERAKDAGYRLAGIVTVPVAIFVMGFLGLATRFIPSGERFWSRLIELSVERFHRSAGGDAVAFNHLPDGRVRPEAVKYLQASDEFQEGDTGGWKAKGREKKWREEAGGDGVHRLGRAPVVLLDEKADKRATLFEAHVADAIEQGDELFVYDGATISPQIQAKVTTLDAAQAGGDAAVADGGQPDGQYVQDVEAWVRSLGVTDKGALSDWLVEIPEGGKQVSVPRVKDAYEEKGSAETLETVKTASYLAGKDGDYEEFLKKIVLYAFGFVALVMFIVFALPGMLGGGGGGGGGSGIIPFTTALVGV